jgi:hypothetical protein
MITPAPKKSGQLFDLVDIRGYLHGGPFKEVEFRDAIRREDWSKFTDKRVLVKGCGRVPVPPWAYMLVLANLGNYPKMVAYGEECAPIVVFRRRDVTLQEEENLLTEATSLAPSM